jgi:hypothetical protein
MELDEATLSQVREVVRGECRAALRAVAEVRADLVAHEVGHAGTKLPDVVGWAVRQFWAMPTPLRIYLYLYALMAAVMVGKWLWRMLTEDDHPRVVAVRSWPAP